jgi:hypothetical protein
LPRKAAGVPPPAVDFTAFATTGGHTGPGWYGVSISYVTDTGFVTAPLTLPDGTWQTVRLPAGATLSQPPPGGWPSDGRISIINLPAIAAAAPPGTTSIIIWTTLGQQDLINPSSTTTPPEFILGSGQALAANAALYQYAELSLAQAATAYPYYMDFYDSSLTIAAHALPGNGDIINSLAFLPVGIGFGSASLAKYHGRMLIIGTTFIRHADGGLVGFVDDRIWISNAGNPEQFDELTGFITVQSEFDGNTNKTAFELFSVLYICKPIGTYATQDNGSEPSDPTNPWRVNLIDGGIGAFHHSVGTISGSQPSLSFNSTGFLANRNGLFLFNGNVLRPELSWKIRAVWARMTHGAEIQLRVAVDIFDDKFYVLMAADGSQLPNLLLMADYSLGLDSNSIRWTIYEFPWAIQDIMMAYYQDQVVDYFLRLGTNGVIYKLDGATNTDNGAAIDNYYQLAPFIIGDVGSLNVFRFIRYRMAGNGTLLTTVTDQGEFGVQNETNVNPLPFPGNYKDQGIQINFTNEKAIVKFRMNATTDFFRMARVDVFGKQRWPTRPNG